MSSEDYGTESVETMKDFRTESVETTKSSEFVHGSDSEEQMETIFPLSDIEKEIEDEHYDDFKTQVEVLVEMGQKPLKPLELTDCFPSDRPGMYLEILPKIIFESVDSDSSIEEIDFPKPIFRLTIDQGTIATVEHESSSAQTRRSKLLNSWNQYEPRAFSDDECISTMKSESFDNFLKTAEKGILESLVQNKTADSFSRELDFLHKEEKVVETSKESALILSGSFVCFEGDKKQIIRSICWHPVSKDIFIASTLRSVKFEERTSSLLEAESDSYTSYVWNYKNHFIPKVFLEYIDDIVRHKFNPSMPNIIAGGSFSGQVVLWNLELEELSEDVSTDDDSSYFTEVNTVPCVLRHSVSSNADHNHTRGITDFVWVPNHIEIVARGNVKFNMSKDSYQLITCGLDGILKFWDLRIGFHIKPGLSISKLFRQLDGRWDPFHSVEQILEVGKVYLPITRFALRESTKTVELEEGLSEEDRRRKEKAISTEFYAGCDDGKVFCGNFRLNRDDSGKFIPVPPQLFNSPHSGSITAIVLSPFICDIFLSTGSRTVAMWKHDIKTMPIFSQDLHTNITSAEWSNTRPAVFILGFEDGSIQIWDLLLSIYEPFLIHFVSTASVTVISVQTMTEEEHIVTVGDSEGTVYLLTLPSVLWKPVDNEVAQMEEFVTKEALQIKSSKIEKHEKKTEISKEEETEMKVTKDETLTDEVLRKNYDDFLELQQIQLKYLGIIKEQHIEGNK